MTMQFTNNNYYHAMDRLEDQPVIEPMMSEDEEAVKDAMSLGTAEIGTTTNPMGNTLESLKSRINEGAGRLEFEFIGKGKGNSQQPTPESFGSKERQDMRELLTINDIKSSVHASVHGESLAGAGREGFSGAQRQEAMKEIQRAVNFAGDVTDGGAIVFHLSEWQRPLHYAGMDSLKRKEGQWTFKGYDTEDQDSQMVVVDKRTGKFIEGIRKDEKVYEPVYKTVRDEHPELVGTIHDGRQVQSDDWVDVEGNPIPKDADVDRLFNRVPKWKSDGNHFEVQPLEWGDFVKRADEWNKRHADEPDKQLTPEELYARTQIQNRVLQAKGQSLFHARSYNHLLEEQEKVREALRMYEAYEGDLPPEEVERFKQLTGGTDFTRGDRRLPSEILQRRLTDIENDMRHIHESSASADAQAQQYTDMIKNVESAEKYGLQRSADSIAKVGMMAMEESKRKGLSKPLYAAPENYDEHLYGSHPQEMKKIVEESRKQMAKRLVQEKKAGSFEQGLKVAKEHIKATLDIGHMNMWRQYFDPVDEKGNPKYKSAEAREKAFQKWMLNETEKLAKDGVIGHVHLTDNYGYGDEHLTPGQGNTPMKEFLKRMEKQGMRDMIVEPGSYNISSAMYDTLSLVGSPVYGVGRLPRFNQVQQKHFGYNAPPFFIAGAYTPSNDWQPWTETPLE
ncbi:sugar phosphate isomerase/epimerase [Candidatus Woesearchaeota archaeon]|nr:sugar phosphate isomerase/epimerase [Candidatus Woesearchaeota archaeon]